MANKNDFKVIKGKQRSAAVNNKPVDPQMTIEVTNPVLVEAMAQYRTEKTPQVLNAMISELQKARVLVPATMHQLKDKVVPVPAIFANKEGERFIWVFTDKNQFPTGENQPKITGYMNMAFSDLVKMAVVPEENLKGVTINPRTEGIVLTQIALKAIQEGKKLPETMPQKAPTDPQLTLEVTNEALENALNTYKAENNSANLIALVKTAMEARVLSPVVMREVDGKKLPAPILLNDKDGKRLLPVYTSKQHLPKELKTGIINVKFSEVIKTAARESEGNNNFFGLIFDPAEIGIRFAPKLIQVLAETPENPEEALKKLAAAAPKQIRLTEQQYLEFEHIQFENAFLPAEFFTEKQKLIDELCARKEEYVDQLFEESYKEKRRYPYLPEDFQVMALGIKEGMDVVRIDFPSMDQGIGSCTRAYLTWEADKDKAHYFGIVRQKNNALGLVEITPDGKRTDHGPCPTEGMELNTILELAERSEE